MKTPRIGDRCRVWYGPDFVREGEIIGVDNYHQRVLIRFDYDIPDEWESWEKLI